MLARLPCQSARMSILAAKDNAAKERSMPHHHSPANFDQVHVSAVDIARALKGMQYPATKADLIDYAEHHGASPEVVGRIDMFPFNRYESLADVETGFSRTQSQGKHRGMK